MVAVEGVPEPVLDHGIDELEIAHLLAAAQVLGVRAERHRFLAAGHDHLGVAVGDLLHADRDGAQARAADLVETPGGRLLGDARGDGGLTGRVLPSGSGEHLAEDHLVHVDRRNARALQCGLDRRGAEFVGRHGAEGTGERSDGRTRRTDNDDIFTGCHRDVLLIRRRDIW